MVVWTGVKAVKSNPVADSTIRLRALEKGRLDALLNQSLKKCPYGEKKMNYVILRNKNDFEGLKNLFLKKNPTTISQIN